MFGDLLKLITPLLTPVITLVATTFLAKLLNSQKKKNQAQEWLHIAEGVVSLITINNPTFDKNKIIQQAEQELESIISGINPTIAQRLIATVLNGSTTLTTSSK